MLATSFLTFFWTLLVIFFMVVYFLILFRVIVDVFRRHDASGWKKAGWLIFIFVFPFISLFAYLVINGGQMGERDMKEVAQAQQQFDQHVRQVAATSSTDEIAKAKELLESGAITQAEYEQIKAKALA
jgi:predicted PurR-regulated permease PerM